MAPCKKIVQLISLLLFLHSHALFSQKCDTVSFQSMYWIKDVRVATADKAVGDATGNIYGWHDHI